MPEYAYEFVTIESPWSEREIADYLGFDYEAIERARAEGAQLAESDPEAHAAFQAHRKAVQRAMIGLA